MTGARIRPATESDLMRLVEVEVEAGRLFLTVGMPEVAADVPATDGLRESLEADRLWLVQVGDEIAAYVAAEVLDGNAHVAQVSVAPPYAGRRLGRDLVRHVEEWGRVTGCPATTLTTFRDVPWNGPYYERLGYRVLAAGEIGPELAATMAHEAPPRHRSGAPGRDDPLTDYSARPPMIRAVSRAAEAAS